MRDAGSSVRLGASWGFATRSRPAPSRCPGSRGRCHLIGGARAGRRWRRRLQFPLLTIIATFVCATLPLIRRDPQLLRGGLTGSGRTWPTGRPRCCASYDSSVESRPPCLATCSRQLVLCAGEHLLVLEPSGPIVPEPFPTLTDVLWLAYYPCVFLAVLLLVRSRIDHFR